ncbi:MAG: LacI family DNA-binding transcriptional regulator [Blautia sp.]|nr:LacI family DNA-binding transcriptional regulator [Blautia sp.]
MKKHQVSVKEIAQLAGTSTATVSRVLNQNGRFSKETEERVRKVIAETGYQLNPLARSLRTTHSNIIGILVPDIGYEFYGTITKKIQETLMENDYMALVSNTGENLEQAAQYVQIFKNYNADGIIYIGNNEITELPELPIVYVDRDPRDAQDMTEENYTLIECDNIQGGYLAGEELIRKGCRHIAYIVFDQTVSTHRKRLQGLRSALSKADLDISDQYIITTGSFLIEEGFAAVKQLMTSHPDVDGIFFSSDSLAFGGLRYLNQAGFSVPGQVKLIGFDDHSTSSVIGLTTIRQPVSEIGLQAGLRMVRMIAGEEIHRQRRRLPVELVVRGTT